MNQEHGLDRVEYTPKKEIPLKNFQGIRWQKFAKTLLIILYVIIAITLFIYPGYFIKIFSDTGYKFLTP